jgi:hypothetical protein
VNEPGHVSTARRRRNIPAEVDAVKSRDRHCASALSTEQLTAPGTATMVISSIGANASISASRFVKSFCAGWRSTHEREPPLSKYPKTAI